MATTATISLRIDPDLLTALKQKARAEDSTVSRLIVRLVEKEVYPTPRRAGKPRSAMDMFPDFEAPDLEQFRQWRGELSRRLVPRPVRRRTR